MAKRPASVAVMPPTSSSAKPSGISAAETQAVVTGSRLVPNSISTSLPATCEGPTIAPMPTASAALSPRPCSMVSICTDIAETTKPCSENASASSRKAHLRAEPAR